MNGRSQHIPGTGARSLPVLSEDWRESAMNRMEDAAEAGNGYAFLSAYKELEDEELPPADYIRIIRLALKAGAHLAAREISAQAIRRHPSDSEIQKYARLLAPPKLVRRSLQTHPYIEANHNWMKQHGRDYRGQWVAILNGQLLGASASFDDLIGQLNNLQINDTKDVLLTIAC
ncbi:MAG: hypothetical protein ACREBD_36550 [Blastocatellia bacterium]